MGNPTDQIQLSISISTDRDGFMRRTCSACGRDFKTEIDPADLQSLLSSYCQKQGLEIGAARKEGTHTCFLWCPYCSHQDEAQQMMTEETTDYLKRIAYRECVLPMMNQLFSNLQDSFGGSRRSGGFISLSVEFKHSRPIAPVRPIHGPEPGDFKRVTFVCCNEKIKLSEYWMDVSLCSFCGTQVVLI
jgi:hypothetical protein